MNNDDPTLPEARKPRLWLTADWHLGETRMDIMMRPFPSPDEQTQTIMLSHNKLVRDDDLVYHLGDVISKSHDPAKREKYLKTIGHFNGRKVLIRGNHDEPFSDEEFAPYFEQIVPHGDGLEILAPWRGEDGSTVPVPVWLTHYPTRGRSDRFNVVGHIHSAWKFQLNMLNAGVDAHNFYPVAASRLFFFFDAICQHYDRDVWVAYQPVNTDFLGKRGKSSSYFGNQA